MVNEVELKKAWEDSLIMVMKLSKACYFYLKQRKVVFDGETEDSIAWTDGQKIGLCKKFFNLSVKDRALVLIHEALHDFLLHSVRAGKMARGIKGDLEAFQRLYNIVSDCKVNLLIRSKIEDSKILLPAILAVQRATRLTERELMQMSTEEIIARILEKQGGQDGKSSKGEGFGYENGEGSLTAGNDLKEGKSSQVIQEGKEGSKGKDGRSDVEGESEGDAEERIRKEWEDAISKARLAGTGKGLDELLFNAVFGRINWKSVLKSEINSWKRSSVVNDWARENRRYRELPGLKSLGKRNAWIFIDVSGSVWEQVKDFLAEVVGIVKEVGNVTVVFWDDDVQQELKVNSVAQLHNLKVRGGGGTVFAPVLEKYAGKIRSDDLMIVFSDFAWFDKEEAMRVLRAIKAKKIFVTEKLEVLREVK